MNSQDIFVEKSNAFYLPANNLLPIFSSTPSNGLLRRMFPLQRFITSGFTAKHLLS
jgi:hypothetical protein